MLSKFVQSFKTNEETRTRTLTFGVMLLGGIAALIAAFVLTLEKFHLYENPDAVLSCSFNLVLNCGQVMQTWQASVFGFPNMLIGMVAFPVIVTMALAALVGVKFPRWWLVLANVGFFLGMVFAYWLFFSSVYVIQVLCPWCLIVTTATTLIFSSMLHYNLKENIFGFKKKLNDRIQRFLKGGFHQMIVLAWIALMVVLVFLQFGEALFA
jgi:uncharacterized membrane protein